MILLAFTLCGLISKNVMAQSYKKFSHYNGGSGIEEVSRLQVVNGESYLLGTTRSANFPVTNATTYKGLVDITLTKYDVNGNVVYATYLGGTYNETITAMQVLNGEVYLTGTTESINYPVTNGSVFKGGLQDVFVTKLNSNGSIGFSTYLGGGRNETPGINALQIIGSELVLAGTTGSTGYPVTNNTVYGGGPSDIFVTKLNAANGNILFSTLYGGDSTDNLVRTEFDNGAVYVLGTSFSTDLPVTVGNFLNDPVQNGFITKFSQTNLDISYARYLGGFGSDFITASKLDNGILHVGGYTYSVGFPVTNGTTAAISGLDFSDGFYTRLDSNGNIIYSTYLATNDLDMMSALTIANGNVYIMAERGFNAINGERKVIVFKLTSSGGIVYSKKLNLGFGNTNSISFQTLNDDFYVSGICQSAAYPTTNGSQFFSGGTGFFTRLDAAGNIVYSSFLGKMSGLQPMKIANGKFHLLANSDVLSYPISDQSVIAGSTDNILIIKQPDGSNVYSGYIGGINAELAAALEPNGDDVYIAGKTSSENFPVTSNTLYNGNGDQYITKFSFCPLNYRVIPDSLSPKIQTACQFGLAQKITGIDITVPSDSLPTLFLNGIATGQLPVKANYQWQTANAPTGPWTNIASATFRDYTPVLGASNQYFRRLTFTLPDCKNELIHISDTASVLANQLTAPTINPAGPFVTCPGSPITIGGTPTVSGGNPPYTSYVWDMGAGTGSNPTVSPNANTIFTLVVTDALGCRQIGQEIVLTYRANAGPDKGACNAVAVQIGSSPIPGLPSVIYDWQPSAGLTATNIPQPMANPVVQTDYILSLTIPQSGGGTCETKDTVRVIPVAAPANPAFAGPDKVLILNDSTSVGITAQAGYSYTWSPGSYLTGNTTAITYYYPGNISMPVPNPATLFVTAQKDGCSFVDETSVATIEARAGLDGCGPRIVGLQDRTPDINEIYEWSLVSGPGTFTGATNLPQVPVSASIGSPSIYKLTVTLNGVSTTDEVRVPDVCSGCLVTIEVDAQYDCPSYDVNGGNVTLTAISANPNAIYNWTPQVGLSGYTGSIVQLTDNVPRLYTVTATDMNDTSIHCTYNIFVNDPAFSKPVFPAPDTVTCIGTPVSIGLPPVSGYTYEWTGIGLSSNLVSNPVATISVQTSYPVMISDGNGCRLTDTVLVALQNTQVNGGADWIICSSGIITLGTPAQPNTSYLWEPQASPWQNGTTQLSVQPDVFVATDISFVVTATTSAGCITKDTVNVSFNNNPVLPDAPDTFICKGNSVLIGNTAIPGVSYQWSPATGLNNTNIAQPLANPTVTTTYTVVATFPGSCGATASDQLTVTVGNAFFSMPDIPYCPANGAFALGNAAPPNMATYNWLPQQLVSNALIANPNTLSPPPNVTVTFTLLVKDLNGCQYRDTMQIIPQISLPNAGPDKTICKDGSTLIGSATNTSGPGITYSWNPSTNLDDPTSPNPLFTGTTGGVFSYTLIKTDNNVSCSATDIVIIRVIDSLLPVINGPTVCQNSCVQIGTNPLPGVQYQWTPSTGLSDPNIANPQACVGAVSTVYTLTATNFIGCIATADVVIGVNPLPAAQVNIPTVTACLGGSSPSFNPVINPPGNYSYLWSPNNGSLSNVNILSPQITILNTGITQYVLQITDNVTGCSNTATASLVVNICPPLAIIGDYLWYDTNSDGLQDPDELGVAGMTVNLYNNVGFNVASTLTDANGFYQFTDVQPGNGYYVIFSKPAGFDFTEQNVGGTAANNNSKADVDGRSTNFNVPAGASITNIDAGIVVTCTVPVTLVNFTATLRNREVFLNWQTSAEYNNNYFTVERSNDAIHFTGIRNVAGHGTTVLPHNYALTDHDPYTGMNYYRLKQVDFDGQSTYSEVVPVFINNEDLVTTIYNPANHSIQINFKKPQDHANIKLYGSNGQLIKNAQLANNSSRYNLSLPVLAGGIYIIQIVSEELQYSKKILISNNQ